MSEKRDPIAPADDAARSLGRELLAKARYAALAVIDPATGGPGISRIALCLDDQGYPLTLVSSLAAHEAALRAHPQAALLVGEPGPKGDPLTHPRLMLQVSARFVDRTDPAHPALRAIYLRQVPKAALYIDFGDFTLARLIPTSAILNGGFGRAWRLAPEDLIAPD